MCEDNVIVLDLECLYMLSFERLQLRGCLVMAVERCEQLFLSLRSVIQDLMCISHKPADFGKQFIGSEVFHCLVVKYASADEVWAIYHVSLQCAEAASLAQFGVLTASEKVSLEIGEYRFVRLRP